VRGMHRPHRWADAGAVPSASSEPWSVEGRSGMLGQSGSISGLRRGGVGRWNTTRSDLSGCWTTNASLSDGAHQGYSGAESPYPAQARGTLMSFCREEFERVLDLE